MEITDIVFDFGGVLIDWNPRNVYKSIFQNEDEMDFFLTHVCSDQWNLEQDRGRSLQEGTAILIKQFPHEEKNIRIYYDRWEDMLIGPIAENVRILRSLKKQFPLYGLTNWAKETFPVALKKYDFLHLFKAIVVSGQEKMVKPDLEIYQLLLKRYNLKASNCLFIDDKKVNIQSADRLGFHTICVDGKMGLKEALEKKGIYS